jgi:hypothetical protein
MIPPSQWKPIKSSLGLRRGFNHNQRRLWPPAGEQPTLKIDWMLQCRVQLLLPIGSWLIARSIIGLNRGPPSDSFLFRLEMDLKKTLHQWKGKFPIWRRRATDDDDVLVWQAESSKTITGLSESPFDQHGANHHFGLFEQQNYRPEKPLNS